MTPTIVDMKEGFRLLKLKSRPESTRIYRIAGIAIPCVIIAVSGFLIASGHSGLGLQGVMFAVIVGLVCLWAWGRLWHTSVKSLCRREYEKLTRMGYSSDQALFLIGKSFYVELSEGFHHSVVTRFPTLDQLVPFYTTTLPSRLNERRAIQILDSTHIEKNSRGVYNVKTWENW